MKHIKLYEEIGEPEREVRRYPNGNLKSERWHLDGKRHREDEPAIIEYWPDGKTIRSKIWYLEDRPHRSDGPALIKYDENGQISDESWYEHGIRHREGAPASLFYRDGKLAAELWFRNGQAHREDGPAVIRYPINDEPVPGPEWWLHDKLLSAKKAQQLEDEVALKKSGVSDDDIQILKDAGII